MIGTLAEFLGVQCKPLYSKSLMCEAFISGRCLIESMDANEAEPWMSKLLDILAPQGNLEVRGPAIENATVLGEFVVYKKLMKQSLLLGPRYFHVQYHS